MGDVGKKEEYILSHDKMYREIEGYEDSLYDIFDIIDSCREMREMFRYGKPSKEIIEKLNGVQQIVDDIKKRLNV